MNFDFLSYDMILFNTCILIVTKMLDS